MVGIQQQCWYRCPIQNRLEDDAWTLATERQCSRGHLVKHRSDGEQIGSCVQHLGTNRLLRHVGNRSNCCASLASSSGKNFKATKRPSSVSSALYTTPIPPPPTFSTTR